MKAAFTKIESLSMYYYKGMLGASSFVVLCSMATLFHPITVGKPSSSVFFTSLVASFAFSISVSWRIEKDFMINLAKQILFDHEWRLVIFTTLTLCRNAYQTCCQERNGACARVVRGASASASIMANGAPPRCARFPPRASSGKATLFPLASPVVRRSICWTHHRFSVFPTRRLIQAHQLSLTLTLSLWIRFHIFSEKWHCHGGLSEVLGPLLHSTATGLTLQWQWTLCRSPKSSHVMEALRILSILSVIGKEEAEFTSTVHT